MSIGKAKVLADASKMSSGDWKSLRQKSVGSSDASSVLGMGRFGSPHAVWRSKVGDSPDLESFVMSLGHIMEPVILGLASVELGMEIDKPDLVLQHPDIECMTCNLDGYATNPYGEEAIVEAKHAGGYLKSALDSWDETGAPPPGSAAEGYWVQVQFQMSVTGIDKGYLAALCDKTFYCIPIARDDDFIARMEREIPAWWEGHVTSGEPPPITGNDAKYVADKHADLNADAEPVDMADLEEDIESLKSIKAKIKDLKTQAGDFEERIKDALGEASVGMLHGSKVVSSFARTSRSVDYKTLEANYPKVYKEVVREKSSRSYRF